MAEVSETTQRQCDRDGVLSGPVPKGTVPDGWLAGLGLKVPGTFGVLDDLCPACASLPVAQVILPAAAPEEVPE
jgi:hypothetical protein